MNDIQTLTDELLATVRAPKQEASPRTRKLFIYLHGCYGAGFLSMFTTGRLVEEGPKKGQDLGVLTTMLVWDNALAGFTDDVVQSAAVRCVRENVDFPPKLPKLLQVCEAMTPRKTHAEEMGLLALPAPDGPRPVVARIEDRGDGRDWARRILYRYENGDRTITPYTLQSAMQGLGSTPR